MFLVHFIMLNSNILLDLIYHVRFERYFNCTEPHTLKFAKLPRPLKI